MSLSPRLDAQTGRDAFAAQPTSSATASRKAVTRPLALVALALLALSFGADEARAQAWSLTKAQR